MAEVFRLDAGAFDHLLLALDPDRDRAGVAYEDLRQRLIVMLQWWGSNRAEELADATFDRVARKLTEGAEVPRESFVAYVRGVARLIHVETFRHREHDQLDGNADVASHDDADDRPLVCLDGCLESLDENDRSLVMDYYATGIKTEGRQEIARKKGITYAALRIRTCRLRDRLEGCVNGCLDRR